MKIISSMNIKHKLLSLLALAMALPTVAATQDMQTVNDTIYNPKIIFTGTPTKYEIAGIRVEGVDNYDESIIIGYSGLAVGQRVDIPGEDIKSAAKRFWRQGLFSKVQIQVEKIYQDQAWLVFNLRQQPRVSQVNYNGMKSGEKKDIMFLSIYVEKCDLYKNLVPGGIKKNFFSCFISSEHYSRL